MLGARSLVLWHVRDSSSRVIFPECAARVSMNVGTQATAKGYVYLQLVRRIFFPRSLLRVPSFSFFRRYVAMDWAVDRLSEFPALFGSESVSRRPAQSAGSLAVDVTHDTVY